VKYALVLATLSRPNHEQAGFKNLASEPDLRQINPAVVSGFITIKFEERSPD
jgi:hypothetical protein